MRLLLLGWGISSWKFSRSLKRFPGWTAAVVSGGIAVILSLILLWVHWFWTPSTENREVAIGESSPSSSPADLGESEFNQNDADDSVVPGDPADSLEGPTPAVSGFNDHDPFMKRDKLPVIPELELSLSPRKFQIVDQQPDEQFSVTSSEIVLPASQRDLEIGNLDSAAALADSPWKSVRNRQLTDSRRSASDTEFNELLISSADKSLTFDREFHEEFSDQDPTRSHVASSDEVDADIPSFQEISLSLESISSSKKESSDPRDFDEIGNEIMTSGERVDDSEPSPAWRLVNLGESTIDELRIEKIVPKGHTLRTGVFDADHALRPARWSFSDFPANGDKRLGYQLQRDRWHPTVLDRDVHANQSAESAQFVESTLRMHLATAVAMQTEIVGPRLKLTWKVPDKLPPDKMFIVDFNVENIGSILVEDIRLEADLGDGLVHRFGKQIVYRIKELAAGQSYHCQMYLVSPASGKRHGALRLKSGDAVFQEDNLSFEVIAE